MDEIKNRHLKEWAYKIYYEALKTGQIRRGRRCDDCGEIITGRAADGHHTDYSKPLAVIWLCKDCHLARHQWRYTELDWTPQPESYSCACGCGEFVTWQGIGRRPKYLNETHRKRVQRRRVSSISGTFWEAEP